MLPTRARYRREHVTERLTRTRVRGKPSTNGEAFPRRARKQALPYGRALGLQKTVFERLEKLLGSRDRKGAVVL